MISTVVVPTIGRRSLHHLLRALVAGSRTCDAMVVVVDDRPKGPPLQLPFPTLDLVVERSWGGGPAAARNVGWRKARTPWVSFLDDDVVPHADWYADLVADLSGADDAVAVTGRVDVPLPADRRPDDDERSTAALASARWITADMSVRLDSLLAVGGFDERFRRAYREDTDLALRLLERGPIADGRRRVSHPPQPAGRWSSVRRQRGNADDALMDALHGPDWRERADSPRGRLPRHVLLASTGIAMVVLAATGRRAGAAVAASLWLAGHGELALARILPGPRTPAEVTRMVLTSLAIPPAATWHAARGRLAYRGLARGSVR